MAMRPPLPPLRPHELGRSQALKRAKSEATNANLNIDMSDVRDVCINQPPGAACLPLLACIMYI